MCHIVFIKVQLSMSFVTHFVIKVYGGMEL